MRNIKKFSLLFLFIIIFLLSSCVKKIEDVNATTTIYTYIEDTTQERKVDNTISQDDTTVVTEEESSVDENELELIEEETTSVEFEKSDINEIM